MNMKQRILMLHSSSDLYGASNIFSINAMILKDIGHHVHVVQSEEGPLPVQLRNEGLPVSIIRLGILRRKYFSPGGLVNRIRVLKEAYKAVAKIVEEDQINHIYSNTTAVLVGAWIAGRQQIFHTWHIHAIIARPKWLAFLLGKIVARTSGQIIVVSEAVKSFWSRYISPEKLKVVYNGIDYGAYLEAEKLLRKELAISDEYLLIGMVGRVSPWKGQSYFLDIAKELCRSYSHLVFIIVGDTFPGNEHLYDKMLEQVKRNGLENRVHTVGFRSDVPAILAALDVFVLPSTLPDPLPTVILEAMASGKPVVATAHGGAREMVSQNETGYLIPWDNAPEAANQMIPLIEEERLRTEMGKKGRERVLQHFSLESFRVSIRNCFPHL